jgi:hypothetical protein
LLFRSSLLESGWLEIVETTATDATALHRFDQRIS